jgi:glutamyl-tRNA synthetase
MPVSRLAPSPTGLLHLGHARTFLIAWWHARSRAGRVLLRIEDLDGPRAKSEFSAAACRDLEWLGIDWDGPALVQSERKPRFDAAIHDLLEQGRAYACICSRSDLATAASAPHAGQSEPRYPGTCRDRFASIAEAERSSGRPAGVRLRVPAGRILLDDAIAGPAEWDVEAEVGDFLIGRRGGGASYQLAVAVDDAEQGITEVVRGDDLLPSAARQWHVRDQLGLRHPAFAHVPLVTDEHGRRLSKRAADLSLAELRARGVDPRVVVAWAARSAGVELVEPAPASAIISCFRLERLPRTPARMDPELIDAISRLGR